ncbi:AEC family transporter [Piscibacillus sp. B03]|uniref:AEC family transporter n=1 Tax=Piscibacillus sp. B03 TaxID=3457430 RepID=UPI003FCE2252
MGIFLQVVLPIVSVFAIGFILQKWKKLDVKPVSAVTIYIFIPFLVFQAFYGEKFGGEFSIIVAVNFILLFAIIAVTKISSLLRKWNRGEESGMILATAFMNSGNYGTPIVLFALGEEAFRYAILFMAVQTIVMNLFGVYYASRGNYEIRYAIYAVFKMPTTYAIIVALGLNFLGVDLHSRVIEMVDFMAAVALPLMMIVLGMQLANIKFDQFETGKVALGTVIKLVLMPVVAWLCVMLWPMPDLLGKVLIILAAMPTAATTTMFALEFRSRPDLVSSVTLVTTLLSIVTLSVLLIFLV